MDTLRERDNMMRFIDKYRELRNLWEIKNNQYHNSVVRRATLEQLAIYMQTWVPEADSTMINNKINNIRNAYKKRFKEVRASRRSGAAADEVQEPKLWYYKHLRFLDDQIEA